MKRSRPITRRTALSALALSTLAAVYPLARQSDRAHAQQALTAEERGWLARAERHDVNGWIRLRIQGAPFERGFQHGYLIAAEYADAIRVYQAMTYQTMGLDYAFFVQKAAELQKSKITPELTEEMACRPRLTTSSAGSPA